MLLHSASMTVVSRVVPSLSFRTLTVTVQTPVHDVSTVIASPTFHAAVSSVSVDDQQFSLVVSSHIGTVLDAAPSTLALMTMDAQPRSDPVSMVIITAPSDPGASWPLKVYSSRLPSVLLSARLAAHTYSTC